MHLKTLSIFNFKNYNQATFDFLPGINCFTGNNGVGKTNILEAIYYLSFCKGFGTSSDTQNIRFDEDFFMIQGNYEINSKNDELHCAVKRGQKKIFKRNKKEYERLSDHIGYYPLVLIYPGDGELINGGSEERRKFIDGVISQYNHDYLYRLMDYNRALTQRNSLLKIFAEKKNFDFASLEIWDQQLINNGEFIYKIRKEFFLNFIDVFRDDYKSLSGNQEQTDIAYESGLNNSSFEELLKENLKKDLSFQYTSAGIHKDNLNFFIDGQPVKKFGSQGQQKTFVIALKLAQYRFIRQIKGFAPLLLFDDIFDKLDPSRVELLLNTVSRDGFGQIFITDTHSERLELILEKMSVASRLFSIKTGETISIKDFGNE